MSDVAVLSPTDRIKRTLRVWQARARGKPLSHAALRQLEQWEWLSRDEVDRVQADRLRALLAHAAGHVPYYREILTRHGVVDAGGAVSLDAFTDLPLLDKATLRDRFEDLKSDDLDRRKWFYETSGGSTGEPARFVQDNEYKSWGNAAKALMESWTGVEQGQPRVVLWGSERDLFAGGAVLRTRVARWLENAVWLNAFRMTEADMLGFVETINRVRPVGIRAYVESIHELARFIEARGLQVHSPRAISTAAGTLHPAVRELVERVFRAPVFDHYGSRETNGIAGECDHHQGLHVSALTYRFELLRADGTPCGPGELGEVVLTSLVNYAMPLIRYRIGDMAEWAEQPCSCGRAWPLLRAVQGRVTDNFVAGDGTLVHGAYFRHLFFFRDWIRKFQIVQEAQDRVRFRIVLRTPGEDPRASYAEDVRDIEDKVRLVMGPACQVDWSIEADIEPSASGKFRYTISKVANAFSGHA